MTGKVLILHTPGTNRDGDLAHAARLAGGEPVIQPLSSLQKGEARWQDYAMLALPGGFSYGDALGAGRLWALDLQTWFASFMEQFIDSGRPVLGICNGFQALVKAGILPGGGRVATLTHNASGHFECRWVRLTPHPGNRSPWLRGLDEFECPVAHGEGRFLMAAGSEMDPEHVALTYTLEDGSPAGGSYPANPNGTPGDIAGITNRAGNVLGMMPHPEDHVHPYQHPRWGRGTQRGLALELFRNGLRMAA